MTNRILTIIVASVFSTTSLWAFNLGVVDWKQASSDFKITADKISGYRKEVRRIPGMFCDTAFEGYGGVEGDITNFDAALKGMEQLEVVGRVENIEVSLRGSVKSDALLCQSLGLRIPVYSRSMDAKAKVFIVDATGPSPHFKVRVQSSHFGLVTLGLRLPIEMEEFITSIVNKIAVQLWASRLGAWVSDRLGEKIGKQFPWGTSAASSDDL